MSERDDAPRSGGRSAQSRATTGRRGHEDSRDAATRGTGVRGVRQFPGRPDTRRSGMQSGQAPEAGEVTRAGRSARAESATRDGSGSKTSRGTRNELDARAGKTTRAEAEARTSRGTRAELETRSGRGARAEAGTQSGRGARAEAGTRSGRGARAEAGTRSGRGARAELETRTGSGARNGADARGGKVRAERALPGGNAMLGGRGSRSGGAPDAKAMRGAKGGPVSGTAALALDVSDPEVTAAPQPAGRPRLWLAPPVPIRAPRATFAAAVIAVVLVGVLGILLINTKTMEQSFRLDTLRKEQAALDKQQQGLEQQLIQASNPGNLHAAARRLGLVPADAPAMIRLPDGKVINPPKPGEGPTSLTYVPQENTGTPTSGAGR